MSEMSGFVSGGVPDCPVDRESVRANILRLESASRDLPQVDCPLKHHFAPGLYAREIFIPAGSVVVGKIHRHSHINVISQGSAIVVTEFGRMEVSAPYTFVSEPGTKRSLIATTDLVWTTIHTNVSDTTDIEALEAEIISPSYEAIGFDTPALERKQ